MVCAAETIACSPLPHSRFSVSAGVSTGKPAFDRGDAAQVHVARVGMQDVAEDDVAHVARLDARALDRFVQDQACQASGRHVFEAAAILADRRAHAAQHDHFAGGLAAVRRHRRSFRCKPSAVSRRLSADQLIAESYRRTADR